MSHAASGIGSIVNIAFKFILLFILPNFSFSQGIYSYTDYKMGTEFNIKLSTKDTHHLAHAIAQAWAGIDHVNTVFSDYIQSSELAHIQSHPDSFITVSKEFLTLLNISNRFSIASEGAFDVTIGALSRLWRRAIKMSEFPSQQKIDEAIRNVGYEKIIRKGNQIKFPHGLIFDFGAIAKGYACDLAYRELKKYGFTRSLVEGGGDLYIGEPPVNQPGWKIDAVIKKNNAWKDTILILKNCGIATSGDKYKYIADSSGNRYAHIIDPHTGYGVKGPLVTTAIAGNGTDADALATVYSILKKDEEIRFRKRIKIWYRILK